MIALDRWLPVSVFILLMTVFQFMGPEMFRYQTDLIADLQLWRVLTGHWVHVNWMHYAFNMAGLLLCFALTDVKWSVWQWGWRILILTSGISLTFYLWHQNLGWYVGFSGVLFGLYVLASWASLQYQRLLSSLLLTFIAIKIILEQYSSVNMTTSSIIGAPVLVDAHLYGVLIALIVLIIQYLKGLYASGLSH